MTEPDAALRGILERNVVAAVEGENAGYHLNHVAVDIDVSELGPLDACLEGLPVRVEGRFKTREHPEGTRWVFKARSVRGDVSGGEAPALSGPPPSA